MPDKIAPFRRADEQPVETESLAAALAHLPDDAPVLLQLVVADTPKA